MSDAVVGVWNLGFPGDGNFTSPGSHTARGTTVGGLTSRSVFPEPRGSSSPGQSGPLFTVSGVRTPSAPGDPVVATQDSDVSFGLDSPLGSDPGLRPVSSPCGPCLVSGARSGRVRP